MHNDTCVKPLQYYCSCSLSPLCYTNEERKLLFWKKMLCSENVLLCLLAKCRKDSIFAIGWSNDVLNANLTTIRDMFWSF